VNDQGEKGSEEEPKESSRYYIKQGVSEADIKALVPMSHQDHYGKRAGSLRNSTDR